MGNQNMENNQGQQQEGNAGQQQNNQGNNLQNNQQQSNQGQQSEKTFTQDDVNRIVQERLAQYKRNSNSDFGGVSERERALEKRERTLEAREKLAEKGLPKELLDAVNCNSKEEMEKSIEVLTAFFGAKKSQKTYIVSTGVSGGGGGMSNHKTADEASIRKAMGLKG